MRLIFHHPLPLDYNAKSASGIRPIKMLEAFKELGYEVDLVTGYSPERKAAMAKIKNNIRKGIKYDFCYSESSTMPTLLCDRHHLPLHPLLDFSFFKFLKSQKVYIGLFYRDIFWRFPKYEKSIGKIKSAIAKFFYKLDLKIYKQTLKKLYLPTELMAKFIPIKNKSFMSALPPGLELDISNNIVECANKKKIDILYIGGLNSYYRLHKLFKAIKQNDMFNLTVCTRKSEWDNEREQYEQFLGPNINIVHKFGKELEDLYRRCDCSSIFVEPQKYWSFAAPVKLFEYLGNYKPIIASANTYAGEFVEKNKIGWTIPYEEKDIDNLLEYISNNPKEIFEKKKICMNVAKENTWIKRAMQVAKDLIGE